MRTARLTTPLGSMIAAASDAGIGLLEFAEPGRLERSMRCVRHDLGCDLVPGPHPMLDRLAEELSAYFEGTLTAFTVPMVVLGTPFQRKTWAFLQTIPYGQSLSYASQALAIGQPKAVRAVGRANGQNRLAILIPCHRVVGQNGQLCGYGGGLWRKRFLLDLERTHQGKSRAPQAVPVGPSGPDGRRLRAERRLPPVADERDVEGLASRQRDRTPDPVRLRRLHPGPG